MLISEISYHYKEVLTMQKVAFLALSVNIDKLQYKLIESLYHHYDSATIKAHNFYVICQGYTDDQQQRVQTLAPDINFIFTERETGTISHIRRVLLNRYNLFKEYDYVILIDDDFKFGEYAMEQYDHHLAEFDQHPEIGMIACHRRMHGDKRIETSPIDTKYPQDLAAISMRNGLIIRSGVIDPDDMFNDEVLYHEEFYLALQIYIRGYEVGKAWVDVYHQSRAGGLGNELQKKYDIFNSNEIPSAKKIAHDQGLFTIQEGEIFYGAPNVGRVSNKAHQLHNDAKKELGFV